MDRAAHIDGGFGPLRALSGQRRDDTDHINISGINPLVGTSVDERFVNLVDAYDPRLRQRLKKASAGAGGSACA